MVIEQPKETGQARRKVWCSNDEIVSVGEGIYSFSSLPRESLGFGSTVYVINPANENKVLLYDDKTGNLYDWTDYLSGGELE